MDIMVSVFKMMSQEFRLGDIFTVGILFFTLIYIIKYTATTVDLKDLEISPFVYFSIENKKFYVKNIGQGLALNINITPVWIILTLRGKDKIIYELKFNRVNLLEPGENEELKFKVLVNGEEETDENIFILVIPKYQKEHDIPLEIRYRNAMGLRYRTCFTTGKSGVVIKKIHTVSRLNPGYLYSLFKHWKEKQILTRKAKKLRIIEEKKKEKMQDIKA